jgi:hypothetical protein
MVKVELPGNAANDASSAKVTEHGRQRADTDERKIGR